MSEAMSLWLCPHIGLHGSVPHCAEASIPTITTQLMIERAQQAQARLRQFSDESRESPYGGALSVMDDIRIACDTLDKAEAVVIALEIIMRDTESGEEYRQRWSQARAALAAWNETEST